MKKTANDWRTTGIVKGVKIKGVLPVEGNGCWKGVGSDSYGYQIGKVAEDGTHFEVLNKDGNFIGVAILATRKNFRGKGKYYFANNEGKPDYYWSCGCLHGMIGISDRPGCCETYLDPSF